MEDLKGKIKSWLGGEEPSQRPPTSEFSSTLRTQREEARRKLDELTEGLTQTRKNLELEFRKKSEERIRLFALLAHSDAQAQSLLEQERAKFHKVQKEYESEIESFESTLKNENLQWQEIFREHELTRHEFLKTSDFKLQEQELDRKRKEGDLEKSLADLKGRILRISEQIESEHKKWSVRILSESEEIVSLKTQLELKDASRKTQELKLQQDLQTSTNAWEQKTSTLETEIHQERRKSQEELTLKESELRAIKLEHERKESMIRLALKSKEDEILSARSRAESKLKILESEMKNLKVQNSTDLKERTDRAEKIRVELILLDSQFKVDSERAEATLITLQKEATSKINFLENKLHEEIRAGQKMVQEKLAELQGLEMQASVRKNQLEDEFAQKKADMENQRLDFSEKLKTTSQIIEEEKAHHRREMSSRDVVIQSLKAQMTKNADEIKAKRDAFTANLEAKKQEISRELSRLEEKSRTEKDKFLQEITEKSRILSDKRSELLREQSSLQHALKKQEDQLHFEIVPLKNQLEEFKSRLEQERGIRQKLIRTKEDVLEKIRHQQEILEVSSTKDLKGFEQSFNEESQKAQSRIRSAEEAWHKEKTDLETTLHDLEQQKHQLEKEISHFPPTVKSEIRSLRVKNQAEKNALEKQLADVKTRLVQESESFRLTFEQHERAESSSKAELERIRENANKDRKQYQEHIEVERTGYERSIIELQKGHPSRTHLAGKQCGRE